jgi:hypothetical protein
MLFNTVESNEERGTRVLRRHKSRLRSLSRASQRSDISLADFGSRCVLTDAETAHCGYHRYRHAEI